MFKFTLNLLEHLKVFAIPFKALARLIKALAMMLFGLYERLEAILIVLLYPVLSHVFPFVWKLMAPPLGWIAWLTRLNRLLPWNYLMLVIGPYYTGERARVAWRLTVLSYLFMVADAQCVKIIYFKIGAMESVVNNRDHDLFWVAVTALATAGLLGAFVNGLLGYIRDWWGQNMRNEVNQRCARMWCANNTYLRMLLDYAKLTNVDARISIEPDQLTTTIVWLMFTVPQSFVIVGINLPELLEHPMWIFWACIGSAVVSFIFTLVLGWPLSDSNEKMSDREAEYRSNLQGVNASARAYALQMSDRLLLRQALAKIADVYEMKRRLQWLNLRLAWFNNVWNRVTDWGPRYAIGFLFMRGEASFAQIAQGANAFAQVYNGLTVLSAQWPAFQTAKAGLMRLGPVLEAFNALGLNKMPEGDWVDCTISPDKTISFQNLTIDNEYLKSKPVVKDLTFTAKGTVLILGADGTGKSRLADLIKFLRARGHGKFTGWAPGQVVAMGPEVGLPKSSLIELLCDRFDVVPDKAVILQVLKDVGLPEIVELAGGLDVVQDWTNGDKKLPVPIQKVLLLARAILINDLINPVLFVLDQTLGGMEPAVVDHVYSVLSNRKIAFWTLANDPKLAPKHDQVVEIDENGTGTEYPPDHYKDKVPGWKSFFDRLSGNS